MYVCVCMCMYTIKCLMLQEERTKYDNICRKAYEDSAHEDVKHANWIDSPWPGM